MLTSAFRDGHTEPVALLAIGQDMDGNIMHMVLQGMVMLL